MSEPWAITRKLVHKEKNEFTPWEAEEDWGFVPVADYIAAFMPISQAPDNYASFKPVVRREQKG
jgi:hypothetical protein